MLIASYCPHGRGLSTYGEEKKMTKSNSAKFRRDCWTSALALIGLAATFINLPLLINGSNLWLGLLVLGLSLYVYSMYLAGYVLNLIKAKSNQNYFKNAYPNNTTTIRMFWREPREVLKSRLMMHKETANMYKAANLGEISPVDFLDKPIVDS